jgi:leucyl aminopeptidase
MRTSDGDRIGVPRSIKVAESAGKLLTIERTPGGAPVAVQSLGKSTSIIADTFRRVGGALVGWMTDHGLNDVAIDVESVDSVERDMAIRAVAEGLLLRDYRYDKHKSKRDKRPALQASIVVSKVTPALTKMLAEAVATCGGVITAREVAHRPPNDLNPITLAQEARALARKHGLKCTVYDERQLARMKANAILAVGQASAVPPRLIVLEYPGRGKSRSERPVVLVGKAVTFDTGGYTLKSADNILGMKYDKCGGTTVLGAMQAIAANNVRTPVVGILSAAENMIAGNAYRPDDIITTMSGKTVQIVSADAEGRMVLCDALTFAQQRFKPRALIDVATLTGGVVVALGSETAGIMSNNEELQQTLIECGRRVHERLWPLPIWDEYFELLRGDDSDMKNSAGREAHAIQGGVFLKQFVDAATPWAHLDIAGVDAITTDRPYCPKGATGFGVRLLMDYLLRL